MAFTDDIFDFFSFFGSSQPEVSSPTGETSFSSPEVEIEEGGFSFGDLIPTGSDIVNAATSPTVISSILGSIAAGQQGKAADELADLRRDSTLSAEQQLAENEKERQLRLELARLGAGSSGAAAAEARRRTQLQALISSLDARSRAARGNPELLDAAGARRVSAAQRAGELGSLGFSRLVQGVGE